MDYYGPELGRYGTLLIGACRKKNPLCWFMGRGDSMEDKVILHMTCVKIVGASEFIMIYEININ